MRLAALVDRPLSESGSRPSESGVSVSLVVGGAIFLGEELAALAGAVGVAGEGEDLGVVHEPVDHGRGDDIIGKGFTPAAERQI
jgi:hypothetical protein